MADLSNINFRDRRVVPSLSLKGWVDDNTDKIDKLLSYFIISDYSQSVIFRGTVTSLPRLVQQHGHDPQAMETAVENALESFLGRYYDDVLVETRTEDIKEGPELGGYNLFIEITATTESGRVNIAEGLQIKESDFERLGRINNRG